MAISACTFGLYGLYWFYKNWQRIRDRNGESLSPFWRAFFAPLWSFSLFRRVHEHAEERGQHEPWHADMLGIAFLLLSVSWRLPEPWWLISLFAFVAVVPVLKTTQKINARTGSPSGNGLELLSTETGQHSVAFVECGRSG